MQFNVWLNSNNVKLPALEVRAMKESELPQHNSKEYKSPVTRK